MNQQFESWLRSGEKNPIFLKFNCHAYIFLRLPKRPGFDYLFVQRQYRGEGALCAYNFGYVGIYNAADGLIYGADCSLICADELDNTLTERSEERLLIQLTRDVRALVERRVSGDRNRLRISQFADYQKFEHLERYHKYYAQSAARRLILAGQTPDDTGFLCKYHPEEWTEDALLDYLADPLGYTEREAERFWAAEGNQEEMLLDFLMHDAVVVEYEKLTDDVENPVHTIRRINEAVRASNAKTVTVTVCKDGQEFTFKTAASALCLDCADTYATWDIAAADRREFEKRFGRGAEYAPKEITRITYGRKTLYKA